MCIVLFPQVSVADKQKNVIDQLEKFEQKKGLLFTPVGKERWISVGVDNILIENSDFSHNEGDSGYGTWMAFCSAITFENCQAQHNTGSYDPSMRTLFCTQVLSQYELMNGWVGGSMDE